MAENIPVNPLRLSHKRSNSQTKIPADKNQQFSLPLMQKNASQPALKKKYSILSERQEGVSNLKDNHTQSLSYNYPNSSNASFLNKRVSMEQIREYQEEKMLTDGNENSGSFITNVHHLDRRSNSKSYIKNEHSILGNDDTTTSNHNGKQSQNLNLTSQNSIPVSQNIISSHHIKSEDEIVKQSYKKQQESLRILINPQYQQNQDHSLSAMNTSLSKIRLRTPPLRSSLQLQPMPLPFATSPPFLQKNNVFGLGLKETNNLSHLRISSSELHLLSPENFKPKRFHQRYWSKKFSNLKDNNIDKSPQKSYSFSNLKSKQVKEQKDTFISIQERIKETQYMSNLLQQSKGFSQRDKEESALPGSKDIEKQFRLIHKNIDKIEDKNNFLGQQSTFLVDFVSQLKKVSLPPKKMGYLKDNKRCSVLNVDNYQMSNRQSDFFTKVVTTEPYKNNLLSISANNDQINDSILKQVIKQLPPKIEHLSLKSNFITNLGISDIALKLQSHTCSQEYLSIFPIIFQFQNRIINLDLENNKIRDLGARALFKGLMQNNTLSRLNLSQNMIGDMCSNELRELLEIQMSLQELYLKWNNLRSESGIAIAQALKKNQTLRVLDISYNSLEKEVSLISQQQTQSFGDCLSEALSINKKLIHLDISSCKITVEDLNLISIGLKKNHTLFGLHVTNNNHNSSFVNNFGFIQQDNSVIPQEDLKTLNDPTVILLQGRPSAFTHSIQGVQFTIHPSQRMKTKDNCWLCEGWEYLEFNYDELLNTNVLLTDRSVKKNEQTKDKNNSSKRELYIHFNFESYKPLKMNSINEYSYQFKRMCPPNKQIMYFISEMINNEVLIIIDENSPSVNILRGQLIWIDYSEVIHNINNNHSSNVKQQLESTKPNEPEQTQSQMSLKVQNSNNNFRHSVLLNRLNSIQTIQTNIFSSDYYLSSDVTIRE